MLYVEHLILDDGATLDLAGLVIYYLAITPPNPFDPATGVTVMDSVGNGGLVPLNCDAALFGDLVPIGGDSFVDLTDFAAFSDCMLENHDTPVRCDCFDGNANGRIDLADFAEFQATFMAEGP